MPKTMYLTCTGCGREINGPSVALFTSDRIHDPNDFTGAIWHPDCVSESAVDRAVWNATHGGQ